MASSIARQRLTLLLQEEFATRRRANPLYSARALARDIGVSPGFVSLLLAGKKSLSLARAQRVADALKMPIRRRNRFLRAALLSLVPAKGIPAHEIEALVATRGTTEDLRPVAVDQFQFFNQWYHIAILDLTLTEGFRSDIAWIAKRLGHEAAVVRGAVDRLVKVGALKREQTGYLRKAEAHLDVAVSAPVASISNFHRQMIAKAQSALDDQTAEGYARRRVTGVTLSVDPAKLEEAKSLIAEFQRQMVDLLSDGTSTELYQLNVQLFPLTTPPTAEPTVSGDRAKGGGNGKGNL